MPDWSYHTLFRPLLFHLPAERARRIVLRALRTLGEQPVGPSLIDFMGHMRPSAPLRRSAWGLTFDSPIGIGAGLDSSAMALPALARFGVGFIEVGPVTAEPLIHETEIQRRPAERAVRRVDLPLNAGVDAIVRRLSEIRPLHVPLGVRLAHQPTFDPERATTECVRLIEQLGALVDFFTVDTSSVESTIWTMAQWRAHLTTLQRAAMLHDAARPLLLCLPPDTPTAQIDRLLPIAIDVGIPGVVVSGGIRSSDGGRLIGAPTRAPSRAVVQYLYQHWGQHVTIIGSGGVHQPQDALDLLNAGASFVQLCSGLIYSGPGLAKRTNEALLFAKQSTIPHTRSLSWIWIVLLGLGMIIGGGLAWSVAATRVILPYDEAFVGIPRAGLARINPRLLPFMAHDRVTLAGTMISIGVLYTQLALWALRDGAHWAWRTVGASATIGFASFFLFLGFGYFDPLHAAVSFLLLVFFLMGWGRRAAAPPVVPVPDLVNDWRWHAANLGQCLFVALGFGLISAGCVIAGVGITTVFVPEDVAYLQTTAAALRSVTPRLVALIAHDRAGFGGALVSNGVAVLLIALWGIRRGARWVWWTFLLGGAPGFVGALSVHVGVGYIDAWHLAPVYVAGVVYVLGLGLLYAYLTQGTHHHRTFHTTASGAHLSHL